MSTDGVAAVVGFRVWGLGFRVMVGNLEPFWGIMTPRKSQRFTLDSPNYDTGELV